MAALSNPRHERFAQELAKGKSATDAMKEAGLGDPRNSTRLMKREEIRRRIDELQSERATADRRATEKAAEALSIDRQWVMAQLIGNVASARDSGDFGPSNRALELLGKELGMFVDRKHLDIDGELRGLSDAQLIAILVGDESSEGDSETSGASRPH